MCMCMLREEGRSRALSTHFELTLSKSCYFQDLHTDSLKGYKISASTTLISKVPTSVQCASATQTRWPNTTSWYCPAFHQTRNTDQRFYRGFTSKKKQGDQGTTNVLDSTQGPSSPQQRIGVHDCTTSKTCCVRIVIRATQTFSVQRPLQWFHKPENAFRHAKSNLCKQTTIDLTHTP